MSVAHKGFTGAKTYYKPCHSTNWSSSTSPCDNSCPLLKCTLGSTQPLVPSVCEFFSEWRLKGDLMWSAAWGSKKQAGRAGTAVFEMGVTL